MIISHRHRFIFLKTAKVGGTSMEVALSSICGQGDIVTPISFESERKRRRLGYTGSRNFRLAPRDMSPHDIAKGLWERTWPRRYSNHISAESVRERIGDEIWNSYLKFSILRDPFDRAVSRYFFHYRNEKLEGDPSPLPIDHEQRFRRYLFEKPEYLRTNLEIVTIDGELVVDWLLRYEWLEGDLAQLSGRLGLDHNLYHTLQQFREKGQIRPPEYTAERMFRGFPEGVQLVQLLAADEIRWGGYTSPVVD